jgi:hypothetical protein
VAKSSTPTPDGLPVLIKLAELAQILRLSVRQALAVANRPNFPKRVAGCLQPRWRLRDIEAFLNGDQKDAVLARRKPGPKPRPKAVADAN